MTTEENLPGSDNTSYKWKIVQIVLLAMAGMLIFAARQLDAF